MNQTAHAQDQPAQDRPVLNIVGDLVALGPVRRDVLPAWLRWENDFAVTRTDGGKMGS
jgi:hypothetical protein